jgi:hypothetical protein
MVAADVTGVSAIPAWQHLLQPRHRCRCQNRQLAAVSPQGVGREDGRAAGVAQDGQLTPLGRGNLGKQLAHTEQVGDPMHAQHAVAAAGLLEDLVLAAICPASLEQDDRLVQRQPAHSGEKRGIYHFHIEAETLRLRVVREVADPLRPTNVEQRADGDEGATAEAVRRPLVKQGGQ